MTLDSSAATIDYCRRARRIRASLIRNPSLRQRALNQLATQRNAQTRVKPEPLTRPQTSRTEPVERGFAEHAAKKLQPFGFSFSDRIELLNAAERIGISRFRANMILALHEHRAGTMRSIKKPATVSSAVSPSFLVILSLEILVVGVVAWACMM